MLIIEISKPSPRSAALPTETTSLPIYIACSDFTMGREDWNRGVRTLQRSYIGNGYVTYLSNGSLRLAGLPIGDLILDAAEVSRVLSDGLQIRSPDFEADLPATEFRRALLPCAGAG